MTILSGMYDEIDGFIFYKTQALAAYNRNAMLRVDEILKSISILSMALNVQFFILETDSMELV